MISSLRDLGKTIFLTTHYMEELPPGMSVADLPPTVACAVVACRDARVGAKASSALPLVGDLAAWAKERQADLRDLEVTRPTLEDIYLELTE